MLWKQIIWIFFAASENQENSYKEALIKQHVCREDKKHTACDVNPPELKFITKLGKLFWKLVSLENRGPFLNIGKIFKNEFVLEIYNKKVYCYSKKQSYNKLNISSMRKHLWKSSRDVFVRSPNIGWIRQHFGISVSVFHGRKFPN